MTVRDEDEDVVTVRDAEAVLLGDAPVEKDAVGDLVIESDTVGEAVSEVVALRVGVGVDDDAQRMGDATRTRPQPISAIKRAEPLMARPPIFPEKAAAVPLPSANPGVLPPTKVEFAPEGCVTRMRRPSSAEYAFPHASKTAPPDAFDTASVVTYPLAFIDRRRKFPESAITARPSAETATAPMALKDAGVAVKPWSRPIATSGLSVLTFAPATCVPSSLLPPPKT